MALSSISELFRNSLENSSSYSRYKKHTKYISKSAYMIIPLFSEEFEVPAIALHSFINLCNTNNNTIDDILYTDAISINLTSEGYMSTYASLASKIKDSIGTLFNSDKLLILKTKEGHTYYISTGAIFNSDMKPLLILSWKLKRIKPNEGGDYQYQFIKPILRIDPAVYVNAEDELQKFIINKIMKEALLDLHIFEPFCNLSGGLLYITQETTHNIRIEIDENPFKIITTDKPSVSTTNRELLDTAITYVDEMIQ